MQIKTYENVVNETDKKYKIKCIAMFLFYLLSIFNKNIELMLRETERI